MLCDPFMDLSPALCCELVHVAGVNLLNNAKTCRNGLITCICVRMFKLLVL